MSNIPSREEALFADALAQPPAERGAFLARACGADVDLLAHLVALVAAHEGPDSLMPSSASTRNGFAPEEKPRDLIGRYKLLQKIGEGGCGVVWMAEQEEPVRRRVAIKVIKLGMDTREVIARFSAERQALAMMDHPGIAKVLDAGATAAGRPYFVMELVRGVPITKYSDDQNLDPKARLELFIQVCHAVQHAHQKGIIHRDLKPSNILVSQAETAATPKVIDFGIAKATQGRLTDATLVTALDQFIGTPAYMSPEQAASPSLDIDTRSDVYSLGVLLYELLVGQPPFDPKALRQSSHEEIRRIIREVEPTKPSTHFSTSLADNRAKVAKARGTDPARLTLVLSGDLDWIVMRALEKNRVRRYETPTALAADITRHLNHEPVIARPPSPMYRMGKFARRNRLVFVAVTTIILTLVAAAVLSILSMRQAVRATRAASAERGKAENLRAFMLGDLRTQLAKLGRLDILEAVTEKSMADFASLEPQELSDSTLVGHAKAVRQIGELRVEQARYSEALESFRAGYERAVTLATRHPKNGEIVFERAQAEFFIGLVYRRQGELAAASEWFTRYRDSGAALMKMDPTKLEWQREFVSGSHNLAVVDLDRGRLGAARSGFVAEMTMVEKMSAENPDDLPLQFRIADVNSWLGTIAERSGELSEAADRFARQIRILEALAKKEPLNARWRVKLADALSLRVSVISINGHRLAARAERVVARALFDALVAQDPTNRLWLTASLAFRLREAMLVKADGDTAIAGQWVAAAREGLEKLASEQPTDRKVGTFLMTAWRLEAEFRRAAGRPDSADAAQRGVSIGEPLVRVERTDDLALCEYANACLVAGRIAAAAGDQKLAHQYWQRASDAVFPLLETSNHWRLLDPAARILVLLGRDREGRAVIDRLHGYGYEPLEPWPGADESTISVQNNDNPAKKAKESP